MSWHHLHLYVPSNMLLHVLMLRQDAQILFSFHFSAKPCDLLNNALSRTLSNEPEWIFLKLIWDLLCPLDLKAVSLSLIYIIVCLSCGTQQSNCKPGVVNVLSHWEGHRELCACVDSVGVWEVWKWCEWTALKSCPWVSLLWTRCIVLW